MVDLRVVLASAGALVAAACASAGEPKPDQIGPAGPAPEPAAPVASPVDRQRAAAIEAISNGEFDRARDLLGELLAGAEIERARALLAAGDATAALASLDRALEMAPRSA